MDVDNHGHQACLHSQLILKALAQQRTYHKQLHKLLNLLHGFYNEHNRRMQFYQTAKSLGKKPRLVKRIFEIRDYTYVTSLPSGATYWKREYLEKGILSFLRHFPMSHKSKLKKGYKGYKK